MGKTGNSGVYAAFIFLLLFLGSGCSTEDQLFENPSYVQARFKLSSPAAMDGKILITEAYLKLDRIQAIGNGETHTNITHPIPAEEPPLQLSKADSSQVKFRLPGRAYEVLDFHLFLIADPYQLVFQEPLAEGPEPEGGNEGVDPGDGEQTGGDNTGGDIEEPADGDMADGGGNAPPAPDAGQDNDNTDDDQGNGENEEPGDEDNSVDDRNDDGDDDDGEDEDGKQKDKKKKKNKDDKDRDDDKDQDDDRDDDRDDGRESSVNVNAPDLDHFFQNARPGMLITGTYENNGTSISIIFVSSGLEKITLRATQNDAPPVRLKEYNNAEITFDAASWLAAIGPENIESAQLLVYQQRPVLFIHKDFNHQLYEILAPRLETVTTLTIHPREDGIF